MVNTPAQNLATMKYKLKTYDRMELFVHKGNKSILQEHAASMGESLNAFIWRAAVETMERDKTPPSPYSR